MERKRAISLYPGKAKCGVTCWVIDDDTLRGVAIGSVPLETVYALVGRFAPNLVLIEDERPETESRAAGLITLPSGTKTRRCHPSWRDSYLPLPRGWGRHLGILALRSAQLGFHELFRRGKGLKLKDFKPVQYSGSWLKQWERRSVVKPRNHT